MNRNKQAEIAKLLTSKELSYHLYITQLLLFILAIGIGTLLFKDILFFIHHFQFDLYYTAIGLISGVLIAAFDVIMMRALPKAYYDDGGINEKLFSKMPVWKIAATAFMIALAEELLFRGVIQTKLGLIIASIIFALIHIRYWTHWYLLINVVVLSFFIGFLYEWSGQQLIPVITMHFTIDFLLGLYIKISHDKRREGI